VLGQEGGALPVLRAGASCSARIRANVREDVLRISLAAFFTEDELDYSYRLRATGVVNRAGLEVHELERVQIRTGPSDVSWVEVLEGLTEGDRIVSGNTRLLREGLLVTDRADSAS
jgi:multidrug efflux pump subunit AcrA (membrane-fusion protein)